MIIGQAWRLIFLVTRSTSLQGFKGFEHRVWVLLSVLIMETQLSSRL